MAVFPPVRDLGRRRQVLGVGGQVGVVGDDGAIKCTESLTLLAGETFAQKAFSAVVVAGDRMSVESVGLCKDPHAAVEFSKDV